MRINLLPRAFRIGLALVVLHAAPARAQLPPEEDPIESMPIRFGPLGLSPTLAITGAGVDSNVFNDASNPQQDLTATVTPRLQARLRAGRLLLSAATATGFVYYRDFADERTVNYASDARADFNLGRIRPFLSGAVIDTRERLNAELDIRAPRQQRRVTAGTQVLLASRTSLVTSVGRSHLQFDDGVIFDGVSLSRTLNDRTDTADVALLVALTPLTTVGVAASWQHDRFDQERARDADSFRLLPSVQFDPTALVRGTVAVGFRRFVPRQPLLPRYSGLVVQTSVGYTLLDRAKFELGANRDLHYSFEQVQPYYLSTGLRVQVTYRLVGPFDVEALGGRERLDYRQIDPGEDDRVDTARTIGAGLGYRIRENVRMGVTWELTRRDSDRDDRRYERQRVFATLTYGL